MTKEEFIEAINLNNEMLLAKIDEKIESKFESGKRKNIIIELIKKYRVRVLIFLVAFALFSLYFCFATKSVSLDEAQIEIHKVAIENNWQPWRIGSCIYDFIKSKQTEEDLKTTIQYWINYK